MITKNSTIKVLTTLLCLITTFSIGQTPGLIYKPAGTALGRSILDPNSDGFVSTTIAGFSTADYGTACELNMVTLPIIAVEPSGDLNTGSSGGHTDIVSVGNNTQESCYILYKTVNGTPYLVVRFRLGGASTSTKGYTLLLDVDGNFGTIIAANNPGFEKEIVLQTGSNGIVAVYNHTVGGTVLANQYPVNDYHQRSIALSTVNGNPDYFYDYYVPYNDLNLANQPVRIAVATVTSASSGISGTISDFNGINDALYNNNPVSIANAIISSFPATPIPSMIAGFAFSLVKSAIPVVNSGITTNSNSISGICNEANGTIVTVYKGGVQIGTATVTSNSWTLNNVTGLIAGDIITAKATATGKSISDSSSPIEVTSVPTCYTPAPLLGGLVNGQTTIPVTWTNPDGQTILANTVRVRVYNQQNNWQEVNAATAQYIPSGSTSGTLSFLTGLNQNIFDDGAYYATVTYNGCTSGYSNGTAKSTTTITAAPIINTTAILASPTIQRPVQVTSTHAGNVYLYLYVNGYQVSSSSPTTVAQNGTYTFNHPGFIEGDRVTVRAQSTVAGSWLSSASNSVIVTASAVATISPVISGSYVGGTNITVSGSSTEPAGTIITLLKNGNQIGTVTVTAYGTWSVTGLTLAANDVLTAKAKATGKTISAASASVTVAASVPTAPAISGTYSVGASTISGTGGLGTVTVFVDGSPIGNATLNGTNWSITNISAQLYKGAVITAKNTVSNVQSAASAGVTVTGVNSFLITAPGGGAIADQIAGVPFNVSITAKDNLNGTGNAVTTFSGTVVVSSNSAILAGGGQTGSFISGVLNPHSVNLTTGGNGMTVTAVSVDDPTATGSALVNINSSLTWNGSLSTDWAVAQNWTPNYVPTIYLDANIPVVPNQPHVTLAASTPGTCKNLNISAGAVVTIDPDKSLTVNEVLTNNTGTTGLIIEDGGTLLNNTPAVPVTVRRFITGNTDFHLLSVPVASSTFGAPFDPSLHDNIWIRRYDEPTGDWSNYFYTQDFIVGKGYSIYMDNTTPSATANFTGMLNVSSLTPELSNANPGTDPNRKGWNLLGNPFASAIDWDLGAWNRSNVDGAVYVWNDATGNYVNWNGTAGDLSNGIIPVAQGFFVKVTGSSPSITIPTDARVHSSQGYYKNTTADILRIGVSSSVNQYSDATFIGFSQDATDAFDNTTDAWKLYGELEAPQIYSMVNGLNLSINMLHKSGNAVELPVYFEAGPTGDYTLSFSGLESYGEGSVYLTDNLNGHRQDVVKNPQYTFTAENGAEPSRFKVGFNPVGINEKPAFDSNVLIFASGKEIKIILPEACSGKVIVSNLAGQTLHTGEFRNSNKHNISASLHTGIYLVTVISDDSAVTKKIFIK